MSEVLAAWFSVLTSPGYSSYVLFFILTFWKKEKKSILYINIL